MFEELKSKIEQFLNPVLQSMDLELFQLGIAYRGKTVYVLVLTDKAHGGITIDQCTFINKSLINKIEEEHWVEGEYNVEVSSPGLDRPLQNKKDFVRNLNYPARFHLSEMIEGKMEHNGVIRDVLEDKVCIETKIQSIWIPFIKINKAVQILE